MKDNIRNEITETFRKLNDEDRLKLVITLAGNLDDLTITKIVRGFHDESAGLIVDDIDAKVDIAITDALESCDYADDHDICGRYLYPQEIAFECLQNSFADEFLTDIEKLVESSRVEDACALARMIADSIDEYEATGDEYMDMALHNLVDNLRYCANEKRPEEPFY